eukprot:jgi/Pico_ML_1/55773/g1415.t1
MEKSGISVVKDFTCGLDVEQKLLKLQGGQDIHYSKLCICTGELEEVFENLILDKLDLSPFGPDLLDPRVDLDAIFD